MPAKRGTTPKPKGRRVCIFPDCGRPNHAFGLCAAHTRQKKLGVPLRPVRPPRPVAEPGLRWCGKCRQFVDEGLFGWDSVRQQPKRTCRPCHADAQIGYVENAGRSGLNHKRRLTRRGITAEQYDAMLAAQDGRCAICHRDRPLDIDHCHDKATVRGLLCGPCNRAIGFMDDDVALLRSAIDYLGA